jgi:hypothetical protein
MAMERAAVLVTALALTACASSRPAEDLRVEQQSAPPAVAPSQITAIDITSLPADDVDCRMRAPTGSRIAVKQCESTAPPTATEEMARNRLLENVEEQRRQQWRLEQQRQQAVLETAIAVGGAAAAPPPQ